MLPFDCMKRLQTNLKLDPRPEAANGAKENLKQNGCLLPQKNIFSINDEYLPFF